MKPRCSRCKGLLLLRCVRATPRKIWYEGICEECGKIEELTSVRQFS